jgi:hypothetical protein
MLDLILSKETLIEAGSLRRNRLPFVNMRESLKRYRGFGELISNGQQIWSTAAAKRERRARQTEEHRNAARQRNTTSRRVARGSLSNEQRSVIQEQDTAAHRDARSRSYQQRSFERQFEVDSDAALQKFCSLSGLQHLYKAKWRNEEFMAEMEKQLEELAATKERLAREWNKVMVRTPDEPIRGCASCGRILQQKLLCVVMSEPPKAASLALDSHA